LVSGASTLDPNLSPNLEGAGCTYYDLDLFPRRGLRAKYCTDIEELFDMLDEKVKLAESQHAVRVFSLSFSFGSLSSRFAYSHGPQKASDAIANRHGLTALHAPTTWRPGTRSIRGHVYVLYARPPGSPAIRDTIWGVGLCFVAQPVVMPMIGARACSAARWAA
jgi:hypothetical protein